MEMSLLSQGGVQKGEPLRVPLRTRRQTAYQLAPSLQTLVPHIEAHEDKHTYVCDSCEKSFNTQSVSFRFELYSCYSAD